MGGPGSGRYLRTRRTSKYLVADSDVLRLDVRELYRDGFLSGDAKGFITWSRYGADVASIATKFLPCALALRLDYDYGIPPGPGARDHNARFYSVLLRR